MSTATVNVSNLCVTVSHPRSGLSLGFSSEAMTLLHRICGEPDLFTSPLGVTAHSDGRLVLRFSVGESSSGRVIRDNPKSTFAGYVHLAGLPEDKAKALLYRGKPLPLFGGVRCQACFLSQTRELVITLPPTTLLPPPVLRATQEKQPEEAAPAVEPASHQCLVLLAIAGVDLEFSVPIEELFKLSLDWTQKGYKK